MASFTCGDGAQFNGKRDTYYGNVDLSNKKTTIGDNASISKNNFLKKIAVCNELVLIILFLYLCNANATMIATCVLL